MSVVRVLGAGPAGGAAALAALGQGAVVEIFEKSPFPRHKVCGEFLSPESKGILERLGVWPPIAGQAAVIRSMELWVGGRPLRALLDEPAYGISRYALDDILLSAARQRGATLHRAAGDVDGQVTVVATGRQARAPRGKRLFGFKAHFEGPANDTVELYFLRGRAYLGVSAIEGGGTNVCGLAEEEALGAAGFDVDAFLDGIPQIRVRLRPLRRSWKWMVVGPLAFGQHWGTLQAERVYKCGDALSFVDPFTGSGILSALASGFLAGHAAAGQWQIADYRRQARQLLLRAFRVSSMFRGSLDQGWGEWLAPYIPARWLLQWTRPHLGALPS